MDLAKLNSMWRQPTGASNVLMTRYDFDEEELMILNKPGVTSIETLKGDTVRLFSDTIRKHIDEFVKQKGYKTIYLSDSENPSMFTHTINIIFDSATNFQETKDQSSIELSVYSAKLIIEGVKYKDPSRKQFLQDVFSEIFNFAITSLASRDASGKKKMDPDIVNLAGGKHDAYAKLYATTYAKLMEAQTPIPKKPGFLSGLFGKARVKTRKAKKSRSHKQKKTRKH